jgi:hypothetical protein
MQPLEAKTHKANGQSVMFLAGFWQAWVAKELGLEAASPLTPKELGQLKLLRNSFGEEASNVIGWAVSNWQSFSQRGQWEAALPCKPDKPHIGFLVAHNNTAFGMMQTLVPDQVAKTVAACLKEIEEYDKLYGG